MELLTARLLIRDLTESDRASVVAWRSDPEVMRWLDNPEGSEPEGWFEGRLRSNTRRPRLSHDSAIVELDSGEPVGWIGVAWSYGLGGEVVVGYALRRESWGNGYAAEALAAAIAFCFGTLKARSVYAECYEANTRSSRAMEKARMRFAGEAASFDPSLGESVRYLATREEWSAPRRRRRGLAVMLALLGLVAVPAGVGAAIDWARSAAKIDHRLLAWPARGTLASDTTRLAGAKAAWRRARPSASSSPGNDIMVVWAGTVRGGAVMLLQSVCADGMGRLAQLTLRGADGEWRVDADGVIDPTAQAVVVEYGDARRSADAAGPATLQLVVAPDALGAGPGTAGFEVHLLSSQGRGTKSQWASLQVSADGMSAAWEHSVRWAPGGSVVVLSRPSGADSSTVRTIAARPGLLMPQRPVIGLADPAWGPYRELDLEAFDDAFAASAWLGSGLSGEIAPLAVLPYERYRVSVLEVRQGSSRRIVLVARNGFEIGCVAERQVGDLARRAVVALGCKPPWLVAELMTAVARPDTTLLEITIDGMAPVSLAGGTAHALGRTPASAHGTARAFDDGELLGATTF